MGENLAGTATGGIWVLVALPLLGALVLLLGGRRTDRWGHLLGSATVLASFVVGVVFFVAMLGKGVEERTFTERLWSWVPAGGFQVDVALQLDQLSMAFVLLITGVGGLIHVYSMGYMEHDPRRRRFFAYLNLFVAAMLLLVLAADYLVVYVGWEGVGLASYLLIGFWQHKETAAVAAKKAFVVNRVGDMGMTLAIMSIFAVFGSTAFARVLPDAERAGEGWLTAIGFFLLLAACGKSAQFPLQSWLLDAMEGPTPVSALIHAATMVTAGVYLVVRSGPIFEGAPAAATGVVVVGAVTLLMGAWIGCAKDDIKKALAGSTMSQIGYMMLAAGLGPIGYAFAIFHLLTHGFFKANMFLGAGSVMHAMGDTVDMRRFGGLRSALPVTFVTFGAGYLAIIGFPLTAGFFSKDRIIEAAFSRGIVVGLVTLVGAGVTAFYMTRLVAMTFLGPRRWEDGAHPHESPKIMTGPLVALGALSLAGGALLLYTFGGVVDWLEPVTGYEEAELGVPAWVLQVGTLLVVAAGVAVAYVVFVRRPVASAVPTPVPFYTAAGRADLYGDTVNEAVFMRPGDDLTRGLARFDRSGVDGAVVGVATGLTGSSGTLRKLQTGFVRSYALTMTGGALLVVLTMLLVRLP